MSKKQELIRLILANLNHELTSLAHAAESAHKAATHEESKAEDSHDTRGLEASYLAGAQYARIESLKKVISAYQFAEPRDFQKNESIEVGALIELESQNKHLHYFLVSQGGGITVNFEGKTVQVITPSTPLAEELIGRKIGDEIEVEGQRISREYRIVDIH